MKARLLDEDHPYLILLTREEVGQIRRDLAYLRGQPGAVGPGLPGLTVLLAAIRNAENELRYLHEMPEAVERFLRAVFEEDNSGQA